MKGLIGFHVRFYDYEANFYPCSRAHLRARIRLSEWLSVFIHPLSGPIKMDAVSGCLESKCVCVGTAMRYFSRCCLTMPGCVDGPLGMREVE